MAPPSGLHQTALSSDFETPFPPLVRSSTAPVTFKSHRADPSHLAPEDAYSPVSPPRRTSLYNVDGSGSGSGTNAPNGSANELRPRLFRRKEGSRSRSRRRQRRFQKLLWVKQSYPDNYTDQATFLEKLQRNPRVKPYDFWPLVADSTVIVQQVCSVIIFVVCFVGIFQERVSPVSVVGFGSFATFIGWLLWDWWVGEESLGAQRAMDGTTNPHRGRDPRPVRHQDSCGGPTRNASIVSLPGAGAGAGTGAATSTPASALPSAAPSPRLDQHLHIPRFSVGPADSRSASIEPSTAAASPAGSRAQSVADFHEAHYGHHRQRSSISSPIRGGGVLPGNSRLQLRLSTIKSAVLIYFTLLGLSPILKSLTRSTSSDSIWAMLDPSASRSRIESRSRSRNRSRNALIPTLTSTSPPTSGTSTPATNAGTGTGGTSSRQPVPGTSSSTPTAVPTTATGGTTTPIPAQHKFPIASLSTNAALMASTVLASRLPSTGQVFSLTLFSIEVFGLFPVFRRYARHRSFRYHVILTVLLLLGAGAGVGIIIGAPCPPPGSTTSSVSMAAAAAGAAAGRELLVISPEEVVDGGIMTLGWTRGVCECWQTWLKHSLLGMIVSCLIAAVAMGGCSWWLIGLQKYKNEIYGPWDPARPIIISRRYYDDE
ncbi:phosphatidylinositol N-acetylglucosaminyltransferase-domain-containing protein [Neurospora crassa]|nr:phosphatidylinositol N-acetylglucosaminyltransferase-domain-containing protein [Neurospora crassa]